jgi:hypothetical protein
MKSADKISDFDLLQLVRRAIKELPDAPLALRRAAIELWPVALPTSPLTTAARAMVRRIAAALTFDSWAVPALAYGMRSLRAPTRHLLYSAMGRDIDLRVSPSREGFAMEGQILGPDEAGTVELVMRGADAPAARVAQLDALGEFRLDDVPSGTYVLTLSVGSDDIVLPPIEVGNCQT